MGGADDTALLLLETVVVWLRLVSAELELALVIAPGVAELRLGDKLWEAGLDAVEVRPPEMIERAPDAVAMSEPDPEEVTVLLSKAEGPKAEEGLFDIIRLGDITLAEDPVSIAFELGEDGEVSP